MSESVGTLKQELAGTFDAFKKEPLLLVGLAVGIGLIYLFVRIYLWPKENPFKIQWISNFWDWVTTPYVPRGPEKDYPYAKVLYRS